VEGRPIRFKRASTDAKTPKATQVSAVLRVLFSSIDCFFTDVRQKGTVLKSIGGTVGAAVISSMPPLLGRCAPTWIFFSTSG
jgi:hypothetical protein